MEEVSTSNIAIETEAVMRGEPAGAAVRKACEDFERFWNEGVKNQPRGHFLNLEVEETCKVIARLAYLEGRRL